MQLLVDGRAHLFQLLRVVGLQLLQLLFQRGAHLADALLVALGQFGKALAQSGLETLLSCRGFGARLARVLAERLAQHVQALVGGAGELVQALVLPRRHRLQLRAEGIDALRLRGGQAVELLPQFAAALALFLAQRLLQPRVRAAQQQHRQQHHGQAGQQHGEDREEVVRHAGQCSPRRLTGCAGRDVRP